MGAAKAGSVCSSGGHVHHSYAIRRHSEACCERFTHQLGRPLQWREATMGEPGRLDCQVSGSHRGSHMPAGLLQLPILRPSSHRQGIPGQALHHAGGLHPGRFCSSYLHLLLWLCGYLWECCGHSASRMVRTPAGLWLCCVPHLRS